MCPVIWGIVACILHIWDALLPLLFLGQSFLLIKSWWIELLLLACPQHEDWENCSFFTWMVHTVSQTSFLSPHFPFYTFFNKLAGIPSLCYFSNYIFTFWSVFFGLNSKGFIIPQTQTENSMSVENCSWVWQQLRPFLFEIYLPSCILGGVWIQSISA